MRVELGPGIEPPAITNVPEVWDVLGNGCLGGRRRRGDRLIYLFQSMGTSEN